MSTTLRTTPQGGFSLIELITVLIIAGALTAIVTPRLSPSDNTLAAQQNRLARDLRHTQALAMNQGRTLVFDIVSASMYRVAFNNMTITNPSTMQPFIVTLQNDVSLAGADIAIDSLGRPVTSSGLLSVERVFTLAGNSRTSTVTLSPVTGFVGISP